MRTKMEEKSREDSHKSFVNYHTVIGGVVRDRLDSEEMDLYRFMIGGIQAK